MSLMDRYPDFWRDSPETVEVVEAMGAEVQTLRAAYQDLLAQCGEETATWGLSLWERQLGIETDVSKLDTYRRSAIKAKLRGAGTVTAAMIRNMAESFTNGEVEVVEDAANQRFTIRFVSRLGVPPNMDDLKAALREIAPAHLEWEYQFRYLLVRDVTAMTLDELQTQKIKDFAFNT